MLKDNLPGAAVNEPLSNELIDKLLESCDGSEGLLGRGGLLQKLTARLVERALEAELSHHLGYEKHDRAGDGSGNSRNGHSSKTLITESGKMEVNVPRDRNGSFEPVLVAKHQRRLAGFDEKVLSLYARGMTVREIQGHLEEMYGTEVSPSLISTITDAVLDDVRAWRNRRLEPVYPIMYVDGLVVKVRSNGSVRKRTVYIAMAVNMEGHKEVLGLWMADTEGAKFWLHVMTQLKNRGVEDVLIACCDGLKGLPQAIEAVFPLTTVQTCIVHMIRNSLRFVGRPNYYKIAAALKPIYKADTEALALAALEEFDQEWGNKYPTIVRSWRNNWELVTPFLSYPPDIRRAIYTTNAIEALNRQLRKALKPKGHFPNDEAVTKVLYLALDKATKKWKRPIRKWDLALQQFAIRFEGRINI